MSTPLRHRDYRHLFAAQVAALIGTGLTTVALTLLAYDLAGGAAGQVLGTALALKMVAYVGIAPLVGAWAHRLPRRALLVGLDLGRAGLVLLLPLVDAVWQVYVLILLLNACSAGFTPVFQATIPDLLPDETDYTRALGLSRLAYELENLLSPALAALLLVTLSYDALFALNGLAFLISATLVLTAQIPLAGPVERSGGVREALGYGLRGYLATPRLRGLLALSLAVAGAGAMVIVNTVVYVRDALGGSETGTAVALAAAGAGAMLAALALPRLLTRFTERAVMLAGGSLLILGLLPGVALPGYAGLLLLWFLLGTGSSLIQTPAGQLLRRSCHAGDRSAFFSAQFALSHLCWLLTYPLAGWLGNAAGLPATFAVLALLVALAVGLATRLWPAGDPQILEHVHAPMRHSHSHVHDEHHQHTHEGWEGPEPHRHPHRHAPKRHRHRLVIDLHHPHWPG